MIRQAKCLIITVGLLAIAAMGGAQTQVLTRHVREATQNGKATRIGRLPAAQTLHIDIVLALAHPAELKAFLADVYDPASPSYRRFVTPQEFTERFGPSQSDYDALLAFAHANGLAVTGGSRDSMDVQLKGSVSPIEKAFHVTLNVYRHPSEDRTFYAPDREPTVDIPFALWHITGLDNFSIPRPLVVKSNLKPHANATTGSCPEQSFCGSDMRAAYYGETALSGAGQNIGLLEFGGYDLADLNTYYSTAGQTQNFAIKGISTDGSLVNCTATEGCDDTEQMLDITQAGGMAPNVSTIYVYVSNTSDTAMLSSMSTHLPLPLNLSSSWFWFPVDPSTDDPYFEKMAAQGQTFFEASGDDGGYTGNALWPTNSAYVISVGGTSLSTAGPGGPWASESGWEFGGGGWGTSEPIPAWQQLPGVITAENQGSTVYRNEPDVAANADYTFYVCADQEPCTANEDGGTSFAAPMWAGYMALANEQAAENGSAPPGFIDPAIYPFNLANNDVDFHQITSGGNGFPCTPGYNLCAGWGSPNGPALINYLVGPATGQPGALLSTTSLRWFGIAVGQRSSAKSVTVTNTGTAELSFTSISASGDFIVLATERTKKVTPCVSGGALVPGGSCVVKVAFTPTQTGIRTGQLTISDNAPNSPQSVSLTGRGK